MPKIVKKCYLAFTSDEIAKIGIKVWFPDINIEKWRIPIRYIQHKIPTYRNFKK